MENKLIITYEYWNLHYISIKVDKVSIYLTNYVVSGYEKNCLFNFFSFISSLFFRNIEPILIGKVITYTPTKAHYLSPFLYKTLLILVICSFRCSFYANIYAKLYILGFKIIIFNRFEWTAKQNRIKKKINQWIFLTLLCVNTALNRHSIMAWANYSRKDSSK